MALLTVACGDAPTDPAERTPGEAYLETALDIMETHSLHRYKVDWPQLRDKVHERAGHIQTPSEAYSAIRHALSLIGEQHSYLITPADVADLQNRTNTPPLIRVAEDVAGSSARIGYVRVPKAIAKDIDALATSYHRGIERVDTGGACGWIVDLRNNPGGSMWPMIAGLGPILGDGVLGYFVDPDSIIQTWSYSDGASRLDGKPYAQAQSPYVLREPAPPVAVLINRITASSAEATLLSFVGRPDTHTIGASTAGASTANYGYLLSDGAVLVLTYALMADRTGRTYGGPILPEDVAGGDYSIDPETDYAYRQALEWLAVQDRCVAG